MPSLLELVSNFVEYSLRWAPTSDKNRRHPTSDVSSNLIPVSEKILSDKRSCCTNVNEQRRCLGHGHGHEQGQGLRHGNGHRYSKILMSDIGQNFNIIFDILSDSSLFCPISEVPISGQSDIVHHGYWTECLVINIYGVVHRRKLLIVYYHRGVISQHFYMDSHSRNLTCHSCLIRRGGKEGVEFNKNNSSNFFAEIRNPC